MGTPRFGSRRAASGIAFAVATGIALALAAPALAVGQPLADLAPPDADGGRSVAFDGSHLYYTALGGTVLHRIGTDGSGHVQLPIVGAAGLTTLSYDTTRDKFWAVDVTGLNVYLLGKDGIALPHFTIVPPLDLPGSCNSVLGCSTVVTLAYDGIDDTLWYVPEGSTRVYHFDTVGHPLGYFDPNLAPECPLGTLNGVAAGRTGLYLSAGTCLRLFRVDKSGARLTVLELAGAHASDVECDSGTFNGHSAWVRDATDGHLRAFALPANTCLSGGGVLMNPNEHWFTGGGTSPGTETSDAGAGEFEAVAVHHGFVLHCDVTNDPNRLQLVWTSDVTGATHRFHMTTAVAAACSPEDADVLVPNTIAGEGTGRFDRNAPCPVSNGTIQLPPAGQICADVEWRLTDGGEPNVNDLVHYVVTLRDASNTVLLVLFIECQIQGNVQEHPTS